MYECPTREMRNICCQFWLSRPKWEQYVVNLAWVDSNEDIILINLTSVDLNKDNYISQFRLSQPNEDNILINLTWVDLNKDNYISQFRLSRPKF